MTFTLEPVHMNAQKHRQIDWIHIADERDLVRVFASHYIPGQQFELHTHSFDEVFLVAEGNGRHLRQDDNEVLLQGQLVFIPAEMAHGFCAYRDASINMINIAFRRDITDGIHDRHFLGRERAWPWEAPGPGPVLQLSPSEADHVVRMATRIQQHQHDSLHAETFCLDLLCLLEQHHEASNGMPQWLAHALRQMQDPGALAEGLTRLLDIAGKTPEHVNRSMRQHCRCTTTEWIQRQRLLHAARLLQNSNSSIKDIAATCGFQSSEYFHRVFKRFFRKTPKQYRHNYELQPI